MIEGGIYIFCTCASISFLGFIAHSRCDVRTTRAALGIILIAAMITPTLGLINGLSSLDFDFDSQPPSDSTQYEEYMEEAMREGIELALREKFSLDEGEVSVRVEGFDIDRMRVKKCVVTLSSLGVFSDFRGIESYCVECGADECEVIIK